MSKILRGVAVAASLALVLSSCGLNRDSADEGEVTIGLIVPNSGALAQVGEQATAGAELALQHAKEDGDLKDIEVKFDVKDESTGPEGAVQAARDLIADDTKLIMGPALSNDCLAVAPFVEQTDAVLMTSLCQTDGVTGGVDGDAPFKNTFGVSARDSMVSKAAAKVISEKYPDVTDYSLFGLDYAWGQATVKSFKENMAADGVDIDWSQEQWVPTDASSYRSQISALDRGLDGNGKKALFLATFGGSTTNFMKQSAAFDLFDSVDFVVNTGGYYIAAWALNGAAEKMWNAYDYHHGIFDNPANKRFVEDFKKKTGGLPDAWALQQYNGTLAMLKAIDEVGGGDAGKVRDALEGIQFESPVGSLTIGEKSHQASVPVAVTETVGDKTAEDGLKVLQQEIVPFEELK